MVVMGIMGTGRELLVSEHHTIALANGKEEYDLLKQLLDSAKNEIQLLQDEGIEIMSRSKTKFAVEVYFTSDWKFMAKVVSYSSY